MITIIHGDNTTASRKKLNQILEQITTVVRFSAKKDAVSDILMGFDSGELFDGSRTVVLESLFSLRGKNQEKLFEEIKKREKDGDAIILYQDTVITKVALAKLKTANVLTFELPKFYFQFMGALIPRNSSKALELMHQMDPADAEQLFYSMVKRVRQLLMLKNGNAQEFQEFAKMGNWQTGKLLAQAKVWTVEDLTKFYSELFKLELYMKSGRLSMEFPNHIDMVIAKALN